MPIESVFRSLCVALIAFAWIAAAPVGASPIILGQGVDQYNFYTSPTPTVTNTVFGKFTATVQGDATDIEYLNLVAKDASGADHWLVQNLPILPTSVSPGTTTFTSAFDLRPFVSSGTNLSSLNYGTVVSPSVATSTPSVTFAVQTVGDALLDAKGKDNGGAPPGAPGAPTTPQTVAFGAPFLHLLYRPNFPNVEQGKDECAPGSAANSLEWLHDTQGLNTTDTLEQRLQDLKARMHTTSPEGTTDENMIQGKLDYIDHNKLPIKVKFMDDELGGGNVVLTPGGTVGVGKGTKPTAKFIFDELNADEDVEIGISFVLPAEEFEDDNGNGAYDAGEPFTDANGNGIYDGKRTDGGHWITAVGKINLFGALGIWFVEDQRQGQDVDEPFVDGSNGQPLNGKYDAGEDFTDVNGDGVWNDSGTNEVGFTWLGERGDGFFDGYLQLLNYPGDEVVDIVVSESVPEPKTLGLLGGMLLALFAFRARRHRRA